MTKPNLSQPEETANTGKEVSPDYLNPLIGADATETCANISNVMQTVYEFVKIEAVDFHDVQPGVLLILQTVWAAAQHTGNLQAKVTA